MKRIIIFHLTSLSVFFPWKYGVPIWWSEVDAYNITKFLNQKWYEVTVMVGNYWQEKILYTDDWIKLYKCLNFNVNWFFLWIISLIILFFKMIFLKWDIYFFKWFWPYVFLWYLMQLFFWKTVILKTSNVINCNMDLINSNWITWKLYQIWLRKIKYIFVQNKDNQSVLKEFHNRDSQVLHNYYNISDKNLVTYDDRKYILWVARCSKHKHPEKFLEIVNNYPDKEFVMICPRQNDQLDFFTEIESQAKSFKNLQFIEEVPFDKIQKYFDEAILFFWTSDYEWFPNTYLQACMWWTPIYSLLVNPDDFINKYNLWKCFYWDFDKMNKFILNFVDKETWESMSSNAFKYVIDNHSDKKEWQKLIDVIESN